FTGANHDKTGLIEAADQGTILLDEIGDLPLSLQVNLLRFLQEGTIDKVGDTVPVHVDVRVVAATNVDLIQAVRQGHFREDLFYRLQVLHLPLPSLRERLGDIELLAEFFLKKFSLEQGCFPKKFSKSALLLLRTHHWPGNIRELINRIRRAVIMSDGRQVKPADLELERRNGERSIQTLAQVRAEAEKQAIRKSLGYSRNNVSEAARQLGISRIYLYQLMQKHGLVAKETSSQKGI
ncbi:MAG: sigma 54-interacting transcriptional regulator, partial [Deltaproteobacteria bacterium]